MAKKLQILRGTTAQNDAYIGSVGELTMDTEKCEIRIHDGTTIGGKIIGSSGASLPILMHIWSDHVLNDISWLRADTFSWQSGDVYVAAYEHLVADNSSKTVWTDFDVITSEDSSVSYVVKRTSTYVGEPVYDYADNDNYGYEIIGIVGKVTALSGGIVTVQFLDGSTNTFLPNGGLTIGAKIDEINGIFINYKLADDGHKICLPDQEAKITALYEQTGIAWYYILDTENKQFKLPRSTFVKYTNSAPVMGTLTTNAFGYTPTPTYISPANQAAFSQANPGGDNTRQTNVANSGEVVDTGAYVDLKSTADDNMHLYFYVGNFEQDSVEQTAGLNSELFNSKADVDLGNIPANYDYVVESQLPTADNGYTWYRKYKSGWVEQGGRVTIASSPGSAVMVTFPIEMADTEYQVLYTAGTTNRQWATNYVVNPQAIYSSRTTTGVGFVDNLPNNNNACWQVSGMATQ